MVSPDIRVYYEPPDKHEQLTAWAMLIWRHTCMALILQLKESYFVSSGNTLAAEGPLTEGAV